KQSLERAAQLADLNAFVTIDEEIVIAQAKAATLRRHKGKWQCHPKVSSRFNNLTTPFEALRSPRSQIHMKNKMAIQ
ncbi:hypothetical protein, partial [Leisingera daeponensis]|uniref:hypothetical protein n=1 Tax=Leisingera daeponensis TaxID=405746 RepID=UPI001C976DC0